MPVPALADGASVGLAGISHALAALGCALWFGGGLATVMSTSAAFRVTREASVQKLGGDIAGRILAAQAARTWAAIALLAGSFALGLRKAPIALCALAALLHLASELGVRPAIQRLRTAMGGSTENVPETDPRRRRFGALHGVSMLLFLGQLVLVLIALLLLELRR